MVVGARRSRRSVRLEIWDTGSGIPESEHENIFREFHRLDSRASASEGLGLGLGLAIVERACALLNHALAMGSVVGGGTVFRVTVPLAAGQSKLFRRAPRADPSAAWSHAGLAVLLVENDLDMRHALSLLLEKWDVEVLEVQSSVEAVALIEETQLTPDALLVDFQLEGGEIGTSVVERIHARTGPIPTRMITANRTEDVARLCGRIGGGGPAQADRARRAASVPRDRRARPRRGTRARRCRTPRLTPPAA